ncbi:hypothetical protein BDD12DRAFT_835133 [Trichophaea hybrida]|nr:hypothetical protein BDD12DRAFT_835133 [Trichophaea hybrida]
MSMVCEIRVAEGSKKRGTSVARFTIEKGSTPGFVYTTDELHAVLRRRGFLVLNPRKIVAMNRIFQE